LVPADAVGVGDGCQLRADAELLQHGSNLGTHGRQGHEVGLGDLFGRHTIDQRAEDAALAQGQSFER
jgi:hypothetical protein